MIHKLFHIPYKRFHVLPSNFLFHGAAYNYLQIFEVIYQGYEFY